MSNFRMVCVDLDGTLLDASQEISEENREALRLCISRGVRVYLVTGRPYCFTRYQAERISGRTGCILDRVGCICANGACIEDGEYLAVHEIGEKPLGLFIGELEKSGCKAFFKALASFYTHEEYDERFLYQHRKELFTEKLRLETYTGLSYPQLRENALHILKVLVYDEDKDALRGLRESVEGIKGLGVSSYNELSIDVTAHGVDKGSGIREVCAGNGIRKEEILAIGDSWNDLPMFAAAGFRVAMGNAEERIKSLADAVTGTNTENGVARALERFVIKD